MDSFFLQHRDDPDGCGEYRIPKSTLSDEEYVARLKDWCKNNPQEDQGGMNEFKSTIETIGYKNVVCPAKGETFEL